MQQGFIRSRIYDTNPIVFLDKTTDFPGKENIADLISLDFSKTFDTVPYGKLLVK